MALLDEPMEASASTLDTPRKEPSRATEIAMTKTESAKKILGAFCAHSLVSGLLGNQRTYPPSAASSWGVWQPLIPTAFSSDSSILIWFIQIHPELMSSSQFILVHLWPFSYLFISLSCRMCLRTLAELRDPSTHTSICVTRVFSAVTRAPAPKSQEESSIPFRHIIAFLQRIPYPILSRLHKIGGKRNRQKILRTFQELTANPTNWGELHLPFVTVALDPTGTATDQS